MAESDSQRILFLDYLRAVACLLVVFVHIYLLGLSAYKELAIWVPGVTGLLFGPVDRNIFNAPILYLAIHTGINFGALGVSIFFLISGFVILRAVERESAKVFLVRRLFRIYPVSLVVVALVGLFTALYAASTGTVSPHTWASVLASGLVVNGFTLTFPTVPVLWSLEFELIFYCLMAALAAFGRPSFGSLLGLSVACMVFTLGANLPEATGWFSPSVLEALRHASFSTLNIPFLLVGAMLYRMTTEGRGVAYVAAAVGVFLATRWGYLALHADSGSVDLPNGAMALAIFVLALWSGMHWRWIKPLRWFADISYPLYLVHVPLGWLALAVLAGWGWGMLEAGIVTGLLVLLIAWLIHITAETPARRFGASITRRKAPSAPDLVVVPSRV